ncbi:MAG TPA: DUF1460 domain-containing protein [Candidatus Aminicenantes bacterium]|nr:DUF1460 domain-containing protein [Candidatus Aminicenantes bacterium]HEB34326.1 DUF1460 domain-containing protein [Candidatus Aminicenantes bacterium]
MMKATNLEFAPEGLRSILNSMNRREFLSITAGIGASMFLLHPQFTSLLLRHENLYSARGKPLITAQNKESRTREIFHAIIKRAKGEEWRSLPLGECMGNIGLLFVGTKYVTGTLEGEGPEACRVDLTGLDCITFFENVLCISRILKKDKTSFDDFKDEIIFTRYREGILTDYTSRLHYTSDWIYDNEKKKVVKNITKEIGGEEFPFKVSFMSRNPHFYQSLKEFPEFIETIAMLEKEINKRKHWYIPKSKIKEAQKHIQTGDIIALATNKEGLDYGHTGLAYQDERGKMRFLHASQKKKKVLLDTELYEYIQSIKTHVGITIARPLEVKQVK